MNKLIIILLLIPNFIKGQDVSNSVGVITISENNYSKENGQIEFLNDNGTTWYSFTFYYDDSDGKWDYPNNDFKILAFHPDYFLIKLRCLKYDDDYFTVVVNEENNLSKKLKRSSKFTFQSWDQYILSVLSVDFDSISNPILTEIEGEKYRGVLPEFPFFEPVTINDEWLKIKWATDGLPSNNSEYKFGWIKWKSNDQIIIKLGYLM